MATRAELLAQVQQHLEQMRDNLAAQGIIMGAPSAAEAIEPDPLMGFTLHTPSGLKVYIAVYEVYTPEGDQG